MTFFAKHKTEKGFSLIELLVVIAIIGILATILSANFNKSKDKATNKALRSELREVQLALELYKAQNGEYPGVPNTACRQTGSDYLSASSRDCGVIAYIGDDSNNDFIPEFIGSLPTHQDSRNSNCDIEYIVADDASWYKLTAIRCLAGVDDEEDDDAIQPENEFARCIYNSPLSDCSHCDSGYVADADFYESVAVYSVGGQCR
ncbi:type II secretion system protein [Candidatus Kaiserbacteria bacterium]|nr:type II secretion system protein [Candidatus Kaiserbacteria bacterium]MCB9812656.1 type II secretion system protein [Candidatus Nomurabacteria bacterium]